MQLIARISVLVQRNSYAVIIREEIELVKSQSKTSANVLLHTRPFESTDVVMPEMSGSELANRAAQLRPEMKVLYMSGHTEDIVIDHGVLGSDTPFLHKPFTLDAITRMVRALLDAGQSVITP